MAGRSSRRKGKRGEYGVRDLLKRFGFEARRGVASAKEPDLVHSIPGVHIEVKNTERLDLWGALAQAKRDARQEEEPVLFFTRNGEGWRVVVDAERWLALKRLEGIVTEFRDLIEEKP